LSGGWVRRQLCELLADLFPAAAHLLPTVSCLLLKALFTKGSREEQLLASPPFSSGEACLPDYCCRLCLLNVPMETAPCPSPLLHCTQSTPPHYLSFSVACLLFRFFSFCGTGVSLFRGLCWFIPGVAWENCMLLICSPVGLHLPSRFGAGVWQHGSPPGFSV
jgi:hypothetical protein